jgi:hypothetical protein
VIKISLLENKGKTANDENFKISDNRGTSWIQGAPNQLPVQDLQSGALYRTRKAKVKRQKKRPLAGRVLPAFSFAFLLGDPRKVRGA